MREEQTTLDQALDQPVEWVEVSPSLKCRFSLIWQWAPPAIIVVLALGAWEVWVRVFDVARWLLPPPSAIAAELVHSRSLLLRHTWVTLEEVLLGFALALVVGVVVAAAIAYSRIVERAAYPFVIASPTVPIIVIAPLLLIWIGYGIWPKVIVVVLISFFPIVVNMVDGLKSVDPDMLNMMEGGGDGYSLRGGPVLGHAGVQWHTHGGRQPGGGRVPGGPAH